MIEHHRVGAGRPALLFLHGLGGDRDSFAPQLDHFAATHECVSWTMPGYGTSDPLDELTFPTLAEAACALLDESGVDRAVVIGQSLGGMVAQQLAIAHPERVDGLVLVATTAAFGKPGSTFNDEFLASRLAPIEAGNGPADLAPAIVDSIVGPDASPEARAHAVASMSRIEPGPYGRSIECLVTWDGRDRLGGVGAPTLCVAGGEDTNSPVRAMERLADAIPGASLEVIADAGHLVNLERPAAFNSLLEGFLS